VLENNAISGNWEWTRVLPDVVLLKSRSVPQSAASTEPRQAIEKNERICQLKTGSQALDLVQFVDITDERHVIDHQSADGTLRHVTTCMNNSAGKTRLKGRLGRANE